MLYIFNEIYLTSNYIPNTIYCDCCSLWFHGKKQKGYHVNNVIPFNITNTSILTDFLNKLITELLITLKEQRTKEYLTGYKYKLTNHKIYEDKKKWPKLELLIGNGIDVTCQIISNIDYLKKNSFQYYTIIESDKSTSNERNPSNAIINWEILIYILRKMTLNNDKLTNLIQILGQFNIYRTLLDKNTTYFTVSVIHRELFGHKPNLFYKLNKCALVNKCFKYIKKKIIFDLENNLTIP